MVLDSEAETISHVMINLDRTPEYSYIALRAALALAENSDNECTFT
jgi:hypothetical protein